MPGTLSDDVEKSPTLFPACGQEINRTEGLVTRAGHHSVPWSITAVVSEQWSGNSDRVGRARGPKSRPCGALTPASFSRCPSRILPGRPPFAFIHLEAGHLGKKLTNTDAVLRLCGFPITLGMLLKAYTLRKLRKPGTPRAAGRA